jgi:hypothetical protein
MWVAKVGNSKVGKFIRILAIAAVSAMGLLWATPAFAYGPNAPVVTINVSTAPPGGAITISGGGFQPGETITLVLHSFPATLGTTTADPSGNFSTPATIPSDTPVGSHTITATGNTSGSTASTGILIATSTTSGTGTTTGGSTTGGSSSSGSLAFTGADLAATAGVGAIALALGGMLVFAGRRRRVTR